MKPILYIFLPLVFPLFAPAQPAPPRLDPIVDWAAIIELTLPANPADAAEDPDATVGILQLNSEDRSLKAEIDHSLNTKLWNVAKSGRWEIFADPELTRRLSFEDVVQKIAKPDTVVRFDPVTYEESVQVEWNHPFPFEAEKVKVRQVIRYYNAPARFDIQTLALGPCLENGEAAYWLKTPSVSALAPPRAAADWAVRYRTEETSPTIDTWRELRNTTGPILTRFVDRIRTDTAVRLYDLAGEVVLPKDRPCLFSCIDTLATFDPQTWKEHLEIREIGIDYEEITELQLVEEWAWYEKEGLLFTRLVAVAPRYLLQIEGDNELETQRHAKFFRRCDERKE